MKKTRSAITYACIVIGLFVFVVPVKAQLFAKGADVGWLSQMEAAGKVFYNDAIVFRY